MTKRYEQLSTIVSFCRPKTIIEIGTHKADRAVLMCREALKHHEEVHYLGYDLFEDATEETNKREMNGKGAGSLATSQRRLDDLKAEFPKFTFELVKGDTSKTLHGTDQWADFVFIDGGHSIETIRGDYEAVKGSRVIAFDDYYTSNSSEEYLELTSRFGCNQILADIPHEVLPREDRIKGGHGVQIAVIGYSSKWDKAIRRVIEADGHKNVSFWRGGRVEPADLVCAVNTLDAVIDLDDALEKIRKIVKKRLFFVIKADAVRNLDFWRSKLERYFQILEWYSPRGDEVVGTAMPLMLVGEWNARGVMADDERFEHTKANCLVTSKRVRPALTPDGEPVINNRRAVIVCFGPTLQETWPQIGAERRLNDKECDIITMSGAHDFLQRRGIVPDYHIECDPRPHKAENITAPNDKTKYYIASCCHPSLIDKLKDKDLWLWHLMNGQASYRIGEEIESERNEVMICGGGSVGLRSMALFYALGYRDFAIYGMDCSFTKGMSKEQADAIKDDEDLRQWAGRHKGKKKKTLTVKCGDKWFVTSPVDVTYTRHFFDTVQRSEGANFTLYGDGLLQEMCRRSKSNSKQEKAA